MTVVWQDIIAFRTANSVTVTCGERHLISVTRYVTSVRVVSFVNRGNYDGFNIQHFQKYLNVIVKC